MDNLTKAVESIVDARLKALGIGGSGKPGAVASEDGVDMDMLKEAAKAIEDKADLKKVLKKLKVAKLSEIEEEDYETAYELLKAAGPQDEMSIDTLKEMFVRVVNENGKAAAKKILKKLKVEKLGELDEDDYEKAAELIAGALGESGGNGEDEDLFGT